MKRKKGIILAKKSRNKPPGIYPARINKRMEIEIIEEHQQEEQNPNRYSKVLV